MSRLAPDRSITPAWFLLILVVTVAVMMLFSNMVYSALRVHTQWKDCQSYYQERGADEKEISKRCGDNPVKKVDRTMLRWRNR